MISGFHKFCFLVILIAMVSSSYSTTLEETFKKRIDATDKTSISVSSRNGNITLSGWDKAEIEVIARKKVRAANSEKAREILNELKISISELGKHVEIETDFPAKRSSGSGFFYWLFSGSFISDVSVEYAINVPHEMDVELRSSNGKLLVDNCRGTIDLRTTNGKIIATDIKGALHCKTTNGSIKAMIEDINLKEDMNFKTTNGSIQLYIPEDTSADLEARTTNGSVKSSLPISWEESKSKRIRYGQLNNGGPLIYLKTTNGSIRIEASK
jgi:DUF4097 and DUF4098 domain-containing protein YvlB